MRYLGGHLGITVSALLDGQLDASSAERAWAHVQSCGPCTREVEREGWVKTRLAAVGADETPPAQLLGSLYGLGATVPAAGPSSDEAAAWAAVEELERRGRGRRRTGIALAGAGSVSAAVLGLASLGGATLGIGEGPADAPTPTLSRTPVTGTPGDIAPLARVHGRLSPGADEPRRRGLAATREAGRDARRGGLRP